MHAIRGELAHVGDVIVNLVSRILRNAPALEVQPTTGATVKKLTDLRDSTQSSRTNILTTLPNTGGSYMYKMAIGYCQIMLLTNVFLFP